jgi:hypothetical protein
VFSRWIVTNITSARGTLHCRETRIPCGDQLVVCGLYALLPRVLNVLPISPQDYCNIPLRSYAIRGWLVSFYAVAFCIKQSQNRRITDIEFQIMFWERIS